MKSGCSEPMSYVNIADMHQQNLVFSETLSSKNPTTSYGDTAALAFIDENDKQLTTGDLATTTSIGNSKISSTRDALRRLDHNRKQVPKTQSVKGHGRSVSTPPKHGHNKHKQEDLPLPPSQFTTPPTVGKQRGQSLLVQNDNNAADRVMTLERILYYDGNRSLLLYNGKMAAFACGKIIVLIDVFNSMEVESSSHQPGFWKLFKMRSTSMIGGFANPGHSGLFVLNCIFGIISHFAPVYGSRHYFYCFMGS